MKRALYWFILAMAPLLALALWSGVRYRRSQLADVRAVALEVKPVPDSLKRWWAETARCLGIDTLMPATVRVFVGQACPESWKAASDKGRTFGGCSLPPDLIWLRSDMVRADVFGHEEGHLRVFPWTHPDRWFPKHGPPACGMAAP